MENGTSVTPVYSVQNNSTVGIEKLSSFSEEQILKYREVFQILDADHSGEMDPSGEKAFFIFCSNFFFVKLGRRTHGGETVKNGNKLIENVGLMDNNNGYEQILEKNGNVYESENNGNNGNNGYNSYMMGRIGGLLGKWRPTNMQLPTLHMARNGNADNDANIDNDGNNCTNGNDKGGIGNNGNCQKDGNGNGKIFSSRAGKGKQSLSVTGLYFVWILFSYHSHLFCVPQIVGTFQFLCSVWIQLSLFPQGHMPRLNNFRAGERDEIPRHGDGSAGGEKNSWTV